MNTKRLSFKEFCFVLFLLGLIISLAFISGWRLGYQGGSFPPLSKKAKDFSDILRVYNIINKEFYGNFDPTKSSEYTIEKLVESLDDPYSYYVTKEEYQKFKEEERGEFVGIGIVYVVENKTPLIIEVFPGSPAEASGLEIGERMTQIDGIDVDKFNNEVEIINRLKNKEKEPVKLKILDTKGETREVIITRERFKIPNLAFKLIENEIGYLKIYQFSPTLKEEFYPLVQQLETPNTKRLVIDLRNNIGGNIDMAVFLANQFIKEGVLVREKSKKSTKEIIQKALGEAPFEDFKITVLTNSRSASAAEVFVSAIKDNGRGKIVGEKTKGKGSEQTFFELSDGSAIYITVGRWFTPRGEWIDGKGIEPDIKVSESFNEENDRILEKAIEILRSNFSTSTFSPPRWNSFAPGDFLTFQAGGALFPLVFGHSLLDRE